MRGTFLCILLFPALAYSQSAILPSEFSKEEQQQLDSFSAIVENASSHDTVKVNSLISLANMYYLKAPDTAIALCKQALFISESIDFKRGLSNVYGWLGYLIKKQGNIPEALEYNQKSLKLLEEAGNRPLIATSLNNIGLIYKNQGDIPQALEYYHKSLRIREEMGDKSGIAISLNNIGVIYDNQGDSEEALEYYHKSLKLREEIGEKGGIASSLNNIGGIYGDRGKTALALEYYYQCLRNYQDLGDKHGIAMSLNNIGSTYNEQGDIPRALEHFVKGLAIQKEVGAKRGIAVSLYNIGSTYLAQENIVEAKRNAERSMEVAREVNFPKNIRDAAGLSTDIAKKEGNYQEALEMYELYIQMRDSIKNEENQKAAIRSQTKYEFEKVQLVKEQRKREAGRLKQEARSRRDNLQYSVVLICLIILGAGLLAMGRFSIPIRIAEGLIFFSFLIFFEFVLVLADPYIEGCSGGAPGIKLLFNAGIAALIFPLHSLFEKLLKKRLVA